MTRFAPLADESLDEDQRRMATLAQHSGPYQAFLRAPRLWEALQGVRRTLSTDSLLDASQREAVMLIVARHWHSTAGFAAHVPLARKAGLDDGLIAALGEGRAAENLSPTLALTIRCAEAILHDHGLDADLHASAVAVLGERAMVEIVGLIGFFSTTALTLNLAGISANAPFAGVPGQYSPADENGTAGSSGQPSM